MRRFSLLIIFICLSAHLSFSQNSDRLLVEQALVSSQEHASADSLPVYHLIRNQLSGRCYFAPECVSFFPKAVKDLGPIRGVLATCDRLTRCTQIGTSYYPDELKGADGRIHEGTKAYRRRRRSK